MADKRLSPTISDIGWGRLKISNDARVFKDAKLYPGGAREWDWAETGTAHSPGIGPGDVQELVSNGAEEIVLSRGMLGRLRVMPETVAVLEAAGVEVHVLKTSEAVRRYNELVAEGRPVGALIHSTC